MPVPDINTYDELPYDNLAIFHTHPSNSAVMAILCGLTPPTVENARVLELGCAAGFNLLAMSRTLPNGRFVGVDLSEGQIDAGRKVATAIGAERVELHRLDIGESLKALGSFDYIIAHGILSWIDPSLRESLVGALRDLLAPNGIAYLSYNTYPGWHSRAAIRDILRFHFPAEGPIRERIRHARKGLEQTLQDLPTQSVLAFQSLVAEAALLVDESDAYINHEYLCEFNHAFRFAEFADLLGRHGLQFLAEARFATNSFAQRPEEQEKLNAIGTDLIRREQYLDFLRNRSFRQSLVCRAEEKPTRQPSPFALGALSVLCRIEVQTPADAEREVFRVNNDRTIETEEPVLRAMLHAIREAGPKPVRIADLSRRVLEKLDVLDFPPGLPPEVLTVPKILGGFADGWLRLFAFEPVYTATPGDRPCADVFIRHQAERSREVTNLLHMPVELTEPERLLLPRLDGTTDRSTLAELLPEGAVGLEAMLTRFTESALLIS